MSRDAGALLRVEGLTVTFATPDGPLHAVRDVSFTLDAGECLAIVGESGSGKSVTARTLVGLTGGRSTVAARRIGFGDHDLSALSEKHWRAIRGREIGLVLQDALVSLDPLRTIGAEVAEPLRVHRLADRAGLRGRVRELLADAGIPDPDRRARQYPHQLSGGLRQRGLIASAIAGAPRLLIADEPTTALDVTVQARILDLLASLKREGTALLLISHDLSVVGRLADRVAVMYAGLIVEQGPPRKILADPLHPYTHALIAAVPSAHAKGTALSAAAPALGPSGVRADAGPAGCPFAARCPRADEQCREALPPPGDSASGHEVLCWHPGPESPADSFANGGVSHRDWGSSLDRRSSGWGSPLDRRSSGEGGGLPGPESPAASRATSTADSGVLIDVDGVSKRFRAPDGGWYDAVREVSFQLRRGEALGLVGESGSGKTTAARIVLGLLEPDAGEVRFDGRPWTGVPERERRPLRGRIQAVYQDPLGSFDPRHTVGRILGEAVALDGPPRGPARRTRIAALLERVGLAEALAGRRPRELSGGQRQRVAIARALARTPEVLVCDEPVSALDVSVQAQVLDLLAELQREDGVALLFISHDLGVIRHVSDRVCVMKDGRVVETGDAERVFAAPRAPYTRELLAAVPTLGAAAVPEGAALVGAPDAPPRPSGQGNPQTSPAGSTSGP